ncbi:MAG: recombination protein O N-terminal domain-containing protein [Prevotella sp.]|nr:recombination protein O N-terminal domain-containing protein [Prevotella sp.]
MLIKTEAIVLRTVKYGDNKVIVDMFTADCGRMSFVASAGRSGKGGVRRQLFLPMALLEIEADVRPRMKLQKLRAVRLAYPMATVPFEPVKLSLALFLSEFLCHALRGEQENRPLFEYISGGVQWLDNSVGRYANFHLVFLMRLSLFLGFYPNLDGYREGCGFDLRAGCFCAAVPSHGDYLSPDEARRIGVLMRMTLSTMHLYKMSRAERNRFIEVLVSYYRIHIPDFPELRSLAVLRELFV